MERTKKNPRPQHFFDPGIKKYIYYLKVYKKLKK